MVSLCPIFPLIFGMIFGIFFFACCLLAVFFMSPLSCCILALGFFPPQSFSTAVFRSRFLLVRVRASVLGLFPLCCLCFPAVCWLGCLFSTFFPAQVAWRRRGGLGVGSQMGCLGVRDIIYIYILKKKALGIDIIWEVLFFRILEVTSSELQGGRGGGGIA